MNQAVKTKNSFLSVSETEQYSAQLAHIPMLSATEEIELATAWYNKKDTEAAKKLVLSHLRFVVKVAKGYAGYGLQLADLIQEGNIGLMKAVKRFNPHHGVRLVSFAVHWIKSEIHEYIIKNWKIVKVATTKAQRKLFFNLRSMKKRLGWFNSQEIKEVAQALNVPVKEVKEMEARLNAHDASLDYHTGELTEDAPINNTAPALSLEDKSLDPALLQEQSSWQQQSIKNLYESMMQLSEREQLVVKARWLNHGTKETLTALAKKLGVSAERIRQIEANAFKKLKLILKNPQ